MAQFARPDADTTIGNYTDELGGVTNIFQSIDEAVQDDNDYIKSVLNPTSEVYVAHLSNVLDPNNDTNHIVRYAIRKQPAGAGQIDLTVELRQGYVSEVSQGTLIDGETRVNIPETFTLFTLTVTDPSLITDYTDLFLRIVASQV